MPQWDLQLNGWGEGGGVLSGGQLTQEAIVRGVIVRGTIVQGGIVLEPQNKETDHYQLHIWFYHGTYAYMALMSKYNDEKQSFADVLQNSYS